jgi:predicted DNA-binding ArsR family transcriptional regulator
MKSGAEFRLSKLDQAGTSKELGAVSDAVSILKAIATDTSYLLFKSIALSKGQIKLRKTGPSKKQYYRSLSALKKAGLIKKKSGEYTITAFGKIIYCIQLMIEEAFENRWKLMAVDSVKTEDAVPEEEFVKFIDALIENKQIKRVLMKQC